MQENQAAPRRRPGQSHGERAPRSREGEGGTSACIRPVFVNGDRVVIRRVFRFEWLDGTVTRIEELA